MEEKELAFRKERAAIGRRVNVVLDRPAGSRHPRFPDLVYPVDYGFVPGVPGGDGEAQDVYLLQSPRADEKHAGGSVRAGTVVAVYHRLNDEEDKWIATPDGSDLPDEDILNAVRFQEQYFRGVLLRERSYAVRTERLVLRPFRESDYDDLFAFLSQLEHDPFEPYTGITYENGRKHLNERIDSDIFLAIALAETGKVIGNLFLGRPEPGVREVGYIVNEQYRRQGYAKEALSAVIPVLKQEGYRRIVALCDARNTASYKVMESVGMVREAQFRDTRHVVREPGAEPVPVTVDAYRYAVPETAEQNE